MNSEKRQRILDGMLEAVGSDGYDDTTVAAVVDRAGVYRQSFYDGFRSKEECFQLAYEHGLERVEAAVIAAARGADGWRERLRAGLRALLEFLDAEPAAGRALIVEVQPAGGAAMSERNAALRRAGEFLARGRSEAAKLPGTPTAPEIAPEAIASGIYMTLHSRLAAGENDGFRELLPDLMFFALLPYFGGELALEAMRSA